MDGASKSTLENEFGVSNEEEVIKKILEAGTIQESEVGRPLYDPTVENGTITDDKSHQFPERQGPKNDAQRGTIVTGQVSR